MTDQAGGIKEGQVNVLRAAGAMGLATFFSRILGLVREQVFAFLFGAGNATDAFNIAFRIPNLLRDLFAEGAMSAALVPTFTAVRSKEGQRRAWRVAGLVFRVLFVAALVVAVFGVIFAPELVSLYASAYKKIPGKFELTVAMTRTMFPFFPLVALAAAFMGILNACGKFFFPAFSSALFNAASIITGVTFAYIVPKFGLHSIHGMAIGVVIGGLVQAFSQLPVLYRVGYKWPGTEFQDLSWYRDPALKRMLTMMLPGTVGLAATQINILVNSILATSQAPGAVSWLNYAFRLMQFPIGILGVSLAAATLPEVSRLWISKDLVGIEKTLAKSLKNVFAVNLPASAGLAFLGYPIIQLIFQYGRFNSLDTRATAMALAAYSIGLTAYSAVKVLVPACYAFGNTRIPVFSSIFSVALTIILNLIMIGPFGYVGLALGTSFAAILNSLLLLLAVKNLLKKAGGGFAYTPLLISFGKNLISSLVMGAIGFGTYKFLYAQLPDVLLWEYVGRVSIPLVRAFKVGVLVIEGVALTIILAKVLKADETNEVVDLFARKIKKKLSR